MEIEKIYIIETTELLNKMMKDMDYSYDVYFRMAVIDEYFKNNDQIWDLYNMMQITRVNEVMEIPKNMKFHKNEFINLINNIKNNSFDFSKPIIINKDFYVIDGAHRMACALYFNLAQVSVIIKSEYQNFIPKEYTKDWFINNNLIECINYAEEQKEKLEKNICIKTKRF